jgi:hypothetical protein
MSSPSMIRAELEAQRCLIEQQHIEIQRLRRRLEVLLRYTAQLPRELDAIKNSRHAAPQPTQESQSNGPRSVRHFRSATISSSVEQSGIVGDGRRARVSRITGDKRQRKA